MLRKTSDEARALIKSTVLISKFNITDPDIKDYLMSSLTDEGDLNLYDITNALEIIFDFKYSFIDIPHKIANDHLESYEYYILGAVHIPALVPFANHPAFIEFTRALEAIQHGKGGGSLIELVYLPDSTMAKVDDDIYRGFSHRPASFLIGMQDNGGLDTDTLVQFLLDLQDFNDGILQLIEANNERGEIAA